MLYNVLESMSTLWVLEKGFHAKTVSEILASMCDDIYNNFRDNNFCPFDRNVHTISDL